MPSPAHTPVAAHLPDSFAQLAILDTVALVYCTLIAVVALAAVFSPKPSRRKAALEVLRLLLPGRRQSPLGNSRQAIDPQLRTPRRSPHQLPSSDS